jgi:hypothetical protein
MKEHESFLLFCVEDGRYALSVTAVERIVFAAEVTPLSDAPETVFGLINVEGEIMPVVDVRRRSGFPLRDMELSDRFILKRAIGILLTGMGADGSAELKLIKDAGGVTFVQDKESSVINGMPGEAVRLGAADHVLPPASIAATLAEMLRR